MPLSKLSKSIVFLMLLVVLPACNSEKIDQNILTTAWLTCEAATGTPTERPFTGKAVLVWNLHPEQDYHASGSNSHSEQLGDTWLTDAPYFIMGDYNRSGKYKGFFFEDHFTRNFDDVGAFLCVSATYTDIEKCTYGSGFYIKRAVADVVVKLVSWPDKQLIAETNAVTGMPDECATTLNTRSLGNHLVNLGNVDVLDWFLQYK